MLYCCFKFSQLGKNMMTTLEKISTDPTCLHDFFSTNNIKAVYHESKTINIPYPIENDDTFHWTHVHNFMPSRGGYYVFNFNNLDLFYSIVFPDYSNSEIMQLSSLLEFIDKLFNFDNHYIATNSCSFSVLLPAVGAENSHFRVTKKGHNNFNFKTAHIELDLMDISFNNLYFSILDSLKNKIETYLDQKNIVINTSIFKCILEEDESTFVRRLYNQSDVKPTSNKDFKKCIDNSIISIVTEEQKKIEASGAEIIFRNSHYFDENEKYTLNIRLENIKILKKILCYSMSIENIEYLIHTISMTAFYNNITRPNNVASHLAFTRYPVNDLNKSSLMKGNYLYFISMVGNSFTLGQEIGWNIMNDPYCIRTNSIKDLYDKKFQDITSSICKLLDSDNDSVCVEDLQIINMLVL